MATKQGLHKPFWSIITIMLLVGVITSLASIGILYQSAVNAEKSRLTALVTSKARLINAVAVFDEQYSQVDHPEGAIGATLSQIRSAFKNKKGFGQTGEFVIGRLVDDQIQFLINSRQLDGPPPPIAINKKAAEPMRRALNNESGTIIGLDYVSREVLAAYQPIPHLNIGFVAKIDMQEVRAPFVNASLHAAVISLFVIVMGVLLISQIEGKDRSETSETFALKDGVTPKEWFIYRTLLLATISIVLMTSSLGLLYQSSFKAEKLRLLDMVETQAGLINAVADFDAKYNDDDFPGGAIKATLKQVSNSMLGSPGFGKSGEFLLGRYQDYNIIFLTPPRHTAHSFIVSHIADEQSYAMKQALAGRSGTVLDLDYRSATVIAAYTPVKNLNAGLVAKIDVQELRNSFLKAGLSASGVSVVAVFFGALLFWRLARKQQQAQIATQAAPISQGLASRHVAAINPSLVIFTVILGGALLAIDLSLPLGVAGGVPYIFFVLTGKLFPKREHTLILAIAATAFTCIGYAYSPQGGEDWAVITNRVLALVAIWLTALTVSLSQAQNSAQKIQASELRKLSLAVEHSPASVIITDTEGTIQYVNQHYTALTGYSREESIGNKCNMTRSDKTPPEVYQELWSNLKSGKEWQGEFRNKKRNGELYWERSSILPITSARGEILNFVALQEDITERKESEQKLKYLATHDNLTGLPTRRLCMDRLTKIIEMAKRKNTQAAVLFIDLDGFKQVNDTHGHEAGDHVLVETAARLRSCVRKSDTVARIGGDEFIVLLSEVSDEQGAEEVASHILKKVGKPYSKPFSEARVGVSIGISLYPRDATTVEGLINLADQAMYEVKSQGKNNYALVKSEC